MITESIIVLGSLGLAFGIFLAFASKKFHVDVNPHVDKVTDALPSINCGACGYAGCSAYAEAVVANKEVPIDLCIPGQKEVADKIANILERDSTGEKIKLVAQLKCNGGKAEATDKFEYKGIKTCKAASLINNGPKSCSHGCIGYGDCIPVCPVGAISMRDNKLPIVDKEKCIGCGKCVKACPKILYKLVPKDKKIHVLCSSKEIVKDVISACKIGCIACKACERACPIPDSAIHVNDNIAEIDYSKCVMCGKCVSACPRKIIVDER
jgi:RnfABCDGE-type electron transport complex B subunit